MTHYQPEVFNPLAYESLSDSIARALLTAQELPLSAVEPFEGSGIYALFYHGDFAPYEHLALANRDGSGPWPIYVGKAAPSARKGAQGNFDISSSPTAVYTGKQLYDRIKNHAKSITQATNLDINDFSVRLLVLSYIWVPMAEVAIIGMYQPVWNTIVDGFGNHDPGKGRANGIRSRWDTLHPGRSWAGKYPQRGESAADISQDVISHLQKMLS